MRKMLVFGMALILTVGCGANQPLTNIQKTPEIISIELEENPTTGYMWSYTAEPADILKEVGNEFKEPQRNGLVGASGVRVFTFEPVKDGEVTLTFNYSRSWENNPPIKTRVITYLVENGTATVLRDETTEQSRSDSELDSVTDSAVSLPKEELHALATEGVGDEFVPDQSLMPKENDWAGEKERAYYQNVIDNLDFSLVNTFVVKSVPSDEEKSVELSYEQAKEYFDALKTIELVAMAPENPNTGGSTSVYIITDNDQLTFCFNGNWLSIAQKDQDKGYIFDGKCAGEQFGHIQGDVYKLIHSEMFENTTEFPAYGTPEWIDIMNEGINENLIKIEEIRDDVLSKINEKLLSHRDGTFAEMPNHHAHWRDDFPLPTDVKYPLTHSDFAVIPTFYERIGENSCVEGEIKIWVKLSDQGHYMVLTPAWFGVRGSNEPVFGFSDSGFYKGELNFDFDSFLAEK